MKYATTSLARYVVALIGIFVVFNALGLGWSKLQWLATALTFGLGFGLQEIFANFVSGLILLIERPIRVGDIITVDEITGIVSRIRMRATTITNWDRKEYIVPNR
ncbi:MAG: mechanosensitive ion channel, partial [Gimesia chilikensis]